VAASLTSHDTRTNRFPPTFSSRSNDHAIERVRPIVGVPVLNRAAGEAAIAATPQDLNVDRHRPGSTYAQSVTLI